MGKTIIVFEDGRVVDTIDEENLQGMKIENGRLVADIPNASAPESAREQSFASPSTPNSEPPSAPESGSEAPSVELASDSADQVPQTPVPESAPARPPLKTPAAVFVDAFEAVRTVTSAAAADSPAETAATTPAETTEEETGAYRPHAEEEPADAADLAHDAETSLDFRDDDVSEDGATPAHDADFAEETDAEDSAEEAEETVQYPWRDATADEDVGGKAGKRMAQGSDKKKALAIALGLVLAAGAGFGGGMVAISANKLFSPESDRIVISPTDQVSTTEAVAAKVIPSVVGITSVGTRTQDFFFGSYDEKTGGVGTGIIVDESGYILTNSHVILDGEVDTLTVLLEDGRDVLGDVLWNDRTLDLAIVKVDTGNLVAAELGDSDKLKIGAYIAAIGNPMGLNFRSSVSQGVVSGLDRTILASSSSGSEFDAVQMDGLIQVDAAINVGNSGGPLVNNLGQVIGINTARNQNGEGMGFAIPINTAKPIVDSVKATGEFRRVYIGVEAYDVSKYLQNNPEANLGVYSGAYIDALTPGFPAEAAGIKAGDVIIEVDGKQINTSPALIKHLLRYKAGDMVEVKVVRDKKEMTFGVKLTDSVD
ncbi:MAG: trypsin-like peptidase domain-containing protein [Clostridiales Family XIII bacterium]|jgi:S1-C subfamily serine protease|nr:trypsin-like peptidase domain-containing protein [Clostridiales Family XIII bacterium]